jgi:hypothetical protein
MTSRVAHGQGSVLVFVEVEVFRLLAESAMTRNNYDGDRDIPAAIMIAPKQHQPWSVRMAGWCGESFCGVRLELEMERAMGGVDAGFKMYGEWREESDQFCRDLESARS